VSRRDQGATAHIRRAVQRARRALSRLRAALPRGGTLPEEVWERRHVGLLAVLAVHVPAIVVFGLIRGFAVERSLLAAVPVAALAAAARYPGSHKVRSCLCAAGFTTASAVLVYLADGQTEMHFHFFVVVSLLTLYQDWAPFGTALGMVVAEHGIVGVIYPHSTYDHAAAWHDPWLWALIHGVFVLMASVANVAAWSINEHDHASIKVELASLQDMRAEQLRYLSEHDPLTGLGNRRLLTDALERALGTHDRGRPVGLLFVDLDGFKRVNDKFGHDIGDAVLVEVGQRIAHMVRGGDVVARLGGDEFVALCVNMNDEQDALRVAERIERAVARPIATLSGDVRVTASVGIACDSTWPHDAEKLLQQADLAMYQAKQLGKDRTQLFDNELRTVIEDRANRERVLREVLDADRLALRYQPYFDDTGHIVGVEALVRLVDVDGTVLSPAPYIEVAEQTGLVWRVTQWVLAAACQQLAEWRRELAPDLVMNVNVSGNDVGQDWLLPTVQEALSAAGLAPTALALELTETAVLDLAGPRIAQLCRLHELGVLIGVDDFGTGYTSLQYLRSLPISFVKLDMSFVAGLPGNREDRAIIAAMATLTKELGYYCVAEGVETIDQLFALRELGVGLVQGYLLSRPVTAEELGQALQVAKGPVVEGAGRTGTE
jgi:diguanylate cyclase (GGDEF)-like protein